jgi:hypothetical protein
MQHSPTPDAFALFLPFAEARTRFARDLVSRDLAPATQLAYTTDVRKFLSYLEETTVTAGSPAKITKADITEYLSHLAEEAVSGVTRQRKLAALREFFRFLADEGIISLSAVVVLSTIRTTTATERTVPMSANIENAGPGPTQIGIRYDPIDAATAAASVSQDTAVAAALNFLALPATQQASAHVETRLVLFTNENRYRLDSSGNKQYVLWQVPAWVVTISGLDIPMRGDIPHRQNQTTFNHEMNVVIDARTGQYLQAFTYR